MKKYSIFGLILFFLHLFSCSQEDDVLLNVQPISPKSIKILSLGDSYTIGQSVCETCRFPVQLMDSLKAKKPNNYSFSLQVIAQTGWTTTNLINAINTQNPPLEFDLVTLLIGVNNQFQNRPFSIYETEFTTLVNRAIALAKGEKSNLIVVSIPDYAYTPFGQSRPNPPLISLEIDQYNLFAKAYCESQAITFVDITEITRRGLMEPILVANDNLHPSSVAYSLFVKEMLSFALAKID